MAYKHPACWKRLDTSFESIGPYDLKRGDLIVASVIISLVTGAMFVRLKAAIFLLIGLTLIVSGMFLGQPDTLAIGLLLILGVFVIGPALRSLKRSKNIYLYYSPEGIVAETPNAKTVYKWATIQSVKRVGSRLFIMISDGCALVLPERVVTRDDMTRVIDTIVQHR